VDLTHPHNKMSSGPLNIPVRNDALKYFNKLSSNDSQIEKSHQGEDDRSSKG